jgi:two-component system response regulator DctR
LLEKPFHDDELREAISEAIGQNESQRTKWEKRQRVTERIESLNDKERAVMDLMFEGLANKVIANRLDVSVRTVESRRSAVLEKMGVGSLANLVRMIAESGH